MLRKLVSRLIVGLAFALPLGFVSAALAQPVPPSDVDLTDPDSCVECHAPLQFAWEAGAHSQTITDPVFREDWESRGSPPDCLRCHTTGYDPATGQSETAAVSCMACHDPVSPQHPLAPAEMSRSAALCGKCHTETQLEWQASQHGQSDLTCVSCHNPHSTQLLAQDVSSLCAACHGTRVAAYLHSGHAAEGLTCTDCHIGESSGPLGFGQAMHSHAFNVDLAKCTSCHRDQIHSPSMAMLTSADGAPPPPQNPTSGPTATVTDTPAPVNPASYAVVAGLLGLAAGIVLAPWLERGFRRLAREVSTHEVTQ